MINANLLIFIIALLIIFILTIKNKSRNERLESFNTGSIVNLSYDPERCKNNDDLCSLNKIDEDLKKTGTYSNIHIDNYDFRNTYSLSFTGLNDNLLQSLGDKNIKPNENMIPYLYQYMNNLNTILIKQNTWIQNFSPRYIAKLKSDSEARDGNYGSLADIASSGNSDIDYDNLIPTVETGQYKNKC